MNKRNLLMTSILWFSLLPQVYAADVRVLVYGEHVGTDVVYHYTLVNNSAGKMLEFAVGVKENDPGYEVADMTLTRLPTGTTWRPHPEAHFPERDLPVPNPASVTSPTQPPGWSVSIGGYRTSEVYTISWLAPQPVYGGPVNVTGADAGQTLSGFSVRVPANSATGPGSIGSVEKYISGNFMARYWLGESWIGKQQKFIFGPIEKQDTTPPTLTLSLNPNTLWPPTGKLIPITVTLTAKDDYDPAPAIKLESITANEPLAAGDIVGASFGTDDRQFKLRAERKGKHKTGRLYTITYSATDASGNKATVSATVSTVRTGGIKPPR